MNIFLDMNFLDVNTRMGEACSENHLNNNGEILQW